MSLRLASFVLRVYAVMQRDFFGIFGVVLLSLIGVLAVVLDIVRFAPLNSLLWRYAEETVMVMVV